MGVGVQRQTPAALPLGKNKYPLYRRLGGPQGQSGQMRKILSPHQDSIPGLSSPYRVTVTAKFSKGILICYTLQDSKWVLSSG